MRTFSHKDEKKPSKKKKVATLEDLLKLEQAGRYGDRNRLLNRLGEKHPAVIAYGEYLLKKLLSDPALGS